MKTRDFRLSWFFMCLRLLISVNGDCQLPESWSGKWFQSGLPKSIEINSTHIESKGVCVETDDSRFLIEDRMDNCFRCLVIYENHHNVLQYKETHCVTKRESLDDLCEKITGDAALFSMFRLDATPSSCPFKDGPPFTFTYNRGSGECKSPVSKSDSCTDDSRMLLRYQACADVLNSESTVEELTCLASWRDGSLQYMVGKLEHKMTSSDEDRYRCFVWSLQDRIYYVAQSGDATCNGLPSAFEGSRTMQLTKADTTHHQNANCKFPSWLSDHHSWHPLDHSKTYHFVRNGTLRVLKKFNGEWVLEMRAACNSIIEMTENRIMIVAHITIGCESGYRCMIFYKRDAHVIEIQQSNREFQNSDDACINQEIDQQTLPFTTLITPLLKKRRCPFLGRYSVGNNNDVWKMAASTNYQMNNHYSEKKAPCESGKQILSLGCNNADTMEFYSECNSDVTAAYTCHGDWIDSNGTSYLIATPTGSVQSSVDKYCFIIYNLLDSSNDIGTDRFKRIYRLQLHALAKSCTRNVNGDPHWIFNITRYADCDGLVTGVSTRQKSCLHILATMLGLAFYVFKSLLSINNR